MIVLFNCERKLESQAISANCSVPSQHNGLQFQDETDVFITVSYYKTQFRADMSAVVRRSNQILTGERKTIMS